MKYFLLTLIMLSGCHCGEHCVKSHPHSWRSEDCYQQYMGNIQVGDVSVPQYQLICNGHYTTYTEYICDKWEEDR